MRPRAARATFPSAHAATPSQAQHDHLPAPGRVPDAMPRRRLRAPTRTQPQPQSTHRLRSHTPARTGVPLRRQRSPRRAIPPTAITPSPLRRVGPSATLAPVPALRPARRTATRRPSTCLAPSVIRSSRASSTVDSSVIRKETATYLLNRKRPFAVRRYNDFLPHPPTNSPLAAATSPSPSPCPPHQPPNTAAPPAPAPPHTPDSRRPHKTA